MSVLVMGVVNVTPDSFSDGGRFFDYSSAVEHGRRLVTEGADIIDVGGESTRPGAEPVDPEVEIDRVIPVIEALSAEVRVSIDTRHAEVAEAAAEAGADLLNDVSASLHEVAADCGMGWIAMHMLGVPATMQNDPHYGDVVADVKRFLVERAEVGHAAGISEMWIDPGIGFGKTHAHNWRLLAHLDELVNTDVPVVVGTSRKGFLGAVTARSDGVTRPAPMADRAEASLATAVHAMVAGVEMVRVHDIAATVAAARLVGDRPTNQAA